MLKGYLAFQENEILKTHDLVQLNHICLKYDRDFKEIEEECIRLTDYGVNIRYPFPLDLNVTDMLIAIKDAQKINDFVLNKLNGI